MARGKLRTFKRTRSLLYRWARTMGNWQPWLELDGHKIVRRFVHRQVGKRVVAPFFGGSSWAGRLLRRIVGR